MTLDVIRDGGCYLLPSGTRLEPTNLFFAIARVDRVFVKVPTARGLADYRAFIKHGQTTDSDIRPLEDIERVEQLSEVLTRFPALARIAERDQDAAHYLAVHQLQHERLRAAGIIGIPDARFAILGAEVAADPVEPAIFQQRIPGASLWDMFDFTALRILPAWQAPRATIAAQLAALIDSALVNHIDWNIKNFVFHGAEQRLYYVDSKPTLFVAKSSNDLNLSGIRTHFLA
jgi:hypothetical protein